MFDKEPPIDSNKLDFKTRSEAFVWMLDYQIRKGIDPMSASEKANEFAEMFAKNMGLPLVLEPELKGVDKYISMAEKIGTYLEKHPKVIEYGIPALTFVAGLFTGKKVEDLEDHKREYKSVQNPDFAQGDNVNLDDLN